MKRLGLAILLLTFAQAQDAGAYPASYGHVKSTRLNPEKARAEATRGAHAGNCKLYAVQGYGLAIPNEPAHRGGYKIIVIDDTTDSVGSDADLEANRIGKAYAWEYNRTAVAICGQGH